MPGIQASSTTDFKNPDHFVPVKGRGGKVYCKVCTPSDRRQGQPMTMAAALRHERESAKHKAKVEEAALYDFNYRVEPDWTTPAVPKGESAWEYDPYTNERVVAYVNFWLEGIAAAEKGGSPQKMDVFISRYDKAYQEENWGCKYEDWDEEEEEWAVEERDGVPGYWYAGGSFDPLAEDDMERDPSWWAGISTYRSESVRRRAIEEKWWPDDPDPRLGWGSVVDEETPWSPKPAAGATKPQFSRPSDVTPESQTSAKIASQQKKRRNRQRGRGRGRGRGQQQGKKGEHAPENATRRVEAQRDPWRAKAY